MKQLLLIAFSLAIFAAAKAQTPDGENKVQIKEGTKLVYDVNAQGSQYQFIVTVKRLKEGVGFDWEMTAPVNKKGIVEMTPEALQSATALMNYFTGGDLKLTDQTTVWVSKAVWTDMHDEDEMTDIVLDSEETETFLRFDGDKKYAAKYNGSTVNLTVSDLKSLLTDNVITVWENENFPIILSMNLGWTIKLKEII